MKYEYYYKDWHIKEINMQYFGGKARVAKELSTFLQSKIQPNQTFVDLFCGSCNVVSKVKADKRIANDLHKEIIALHIAVRFRLDGLKRMNQDYNFDYTDRHIGWDITGVLSPSNIQSTLG